MPLPRTLINRLVLFIGLCGAAVCIDAAPLKQAASFKSTTEQTGMLELYTSEGCSSCPPADSWLSSLKNEDGLWREFIPLAFHVDYWDYIGWQDRFASPRTVIGNGNTHASGRLKRFTRQDFYTMAKSGTAGSADVPST